MLTINDNWLLAMKKVAPEMRMIVRLVLDDGEHVATSGPVAFDSVYSIASVAKASPFAAELDLIKRKASVSEMTVTFAADGWARDLVVGNYLRGKQLIVEIGEASLAEDDYVSLFSGVIGGITPHPDGTIDVRAENGMAIIRQSKVMGYWFNMHPLEVIADILDKAEVPADLIDAPSLDPSAYPSMEHWVVSRGPKSLGLAVDLAVSSPTPAMPLLDEIAAVVNGFFVDGEDGKVRFVLFDPEASSVGDWTEDDFWDLAQRDICADIINDAVIYFSTGASGGFERSQRSQDAASITAFGFPGSTGQKISEKVESKWINPRTRLASSGIGLSLAIDITAGAGDVFYLIGSSLHAFCGTRAPGWPSTPQDAGAKLSDDNTAVLEFRDLLDRQEFIEIDRLEILDFATKNITDPNTGALISTRVPSQAQCRIKERGVWGTVARHWYSGGSDFATVQKIPWVTDCTIPKAMGQALVDRNSFGAPVIAVKTGLDMFAYQLGDIVTATTDKFVGFGDDGLTTSTKWEITKKELDPFSDEPCIQWELTRAVKGVFAPVTTTDYVAPARGFSPLADRAILQLRSLLTLGMRIEEGLTGSAGTGLNIDIAEGAASTLSTRSEVPDTTIPLDANATHWIVLDGETDDLMRFTGADKPEALASNQIILSRVVTDGSGVTAVTNYPNLGVLQTGVLTARSMTTATRRGSLLPNGDFGSYRK